MTAVDAEPGMVARAAPAAPEADMRLAALPRLPFTDAEFDAVVGNFALNHVQAAGITRPAHLSALAPEDDILCTEQGFAPTLEERWSGPAAGTATVGQIITSQNPVVIAEIKSRLASLSVEFPANRE